MVKIGSVAWWVLFYHSLFQAGSVPARHIQLRITLIAVHVRRPRANIVAVFTHKNEKKTLLSLKCSKFYFEVFFQLSYEIKSKFLIRHIALLSKTQTKGAKYKK
jgi:hypothetical protein